MTGTWQQQKRIRRAMIQTSNRTHDVRMFRERCGDELVSAAKAARQIRIRTSGGRPRVVIVDLEGFKQRAGLITTGEAVAMLAEELREYAAGRRTTPFPIQPLGRHWGVKLAPVIGHAGTFLWRASEIEGLKQVIRQAKVEP